MKEDGSYGFHSDGPRFGKAFIEYLKEKDIANLLELDRRFPKAGECELCSFCFVLGILEASGIDWEAEVLSYQTSFGVGCLVIGFKL